MSLRDILVHFGITVDQAPLREASANVNNLVIQFNRLQRIAGFALGALSARMLVDSADEYINLQNRLRAVTNSTEEFNVAQKGVVDIARETSTPIQDIAASYQRYSMATEGLGKSQEEVLEFTKRLTQATVLGGATAAESRGALIQFAQGMGTNFKAAGQEIRSIQEQAPLLAKIIAKAAGGSATQLKELAKAGKITSEGVFKALIEAGADLDAQMAKRQRTFGQFWVRMRTEGMQFVKQLLPAFSRLIRELDTLVEWTRKWVESGSAMNAFIAAGITLVTALTVALGGLAARLALAAAPFIALFVILEDLVTFLRGGDSYIGELLGTDRADKLRDRLNEIVEAAQGWAKALAGDNDEAAKAFADLFASRFKTAMMAAVDSVLEYLKSKLIEGGRELTGIRPMGPQNQQDANAVQDPQDNPFLKRAANFLLGGDELRKRVVEARLANGWTPEQAGAEIAMPPTVPTMAPMPSFRAPPSAGQYGPPLPPAQVTNNITVEGNATPATAREVARQAGTATADALGRDRSAIGAAVGVTP